ncbi:MAG: tRNA 2-thiouridine(34) synthase MnmA [Bacteroidales bacterium]|nr:tRNA 2-thiouridine(34) synthase MnmA [Bacteroidales bacterium]
MVIFAGVKKKVIVGLSGGVDSSVAAHVLLEQGYDVEALFMRNWHDTTGLIQSECHWEDDVMFAEMVAKKLGIPFHFTDLSDEYRRRVVDYMFAEYGRGRTPNPDILCNREIKFDSFASEAGKLGCDFIATGHYCRKELSVQHNKVIYRLLAGTDRNKDQSYFLCQVTQDQLAGALFPVGGMTKSEVRETAARLRLPTAHRKDSQGICFVGKVHLPVFLQQKLKPREGKIIDIPADAIPEIRKSFPEISSAGTEELKSLASPYRFTPEAGKIAGYHNGAHFYTIGQRKGLNIGGRREPLFVIATDTVENIIYVGEGRSHPGLYRRGLFIRKVDIHWIRPDLGMAEGEIREYNVRIRYRQPLQKAHLFCRPEGIYIIFQRLQRGITPGQFAAWYDGDEVLGSGVIAE